MMDYRVIISILLVLGIGLGQSTCVDSNSIQNDYAIYVNGSLSKIISLNETCEYGCDTVTNRCNEVNDYGFMIVLGLMFFISVLFWLAWFLKPKNPDEFSVPTMTLSVVFLITGLLSLLGLLLYLSGIVNGYNSTFLAQSILFIGGVADWFGYLVWIFALMIVLFYLIRIVRDRLMKADSGKYE